MAKRELDAYTLRAVARECRKEARECFASELRFRKASSLSNEKSAEFFRGFGCSAMHRADDLLRRARGLTKPPSKRSKRRG